MEHKKMEEQTKVGMFEKEEKQIENSHYCGRSAQYH